jgi:tetratricopeptide (TPR) repeat protein
MNSSLSKLIKDVLIMVVAGLLVTAIVAVLGALSIKSALAILVGVIVALLLYVRFATQKSTLSGVTHRVKKYPERQRQAFWALIVLPLSCITAIAFWYSTHRLHHDSQQLTPASPPSIENQQNAKSAKTVTVLIAEFIGPNPEAYGVTRIVRNALEELPGTYPDIRIEYLNEVIDNKETAERRGKELKANIVIWGNYIVNKSHTLVTAYFHMLHKPVYFPIESEKLSVKSSITELESFTIQDSLSNRLRYLVLVTSGLSSYVARDYLAAIKTFNDVIATAPQRSELSSCYFFRGNAYAFSGKHDEAINDLTHAIASRPLFVSAWNNLGASLSELGKHDRAIKCFRKAINIKEDHANAHANLGNEYLDKHQYDLADSELRKAIKIQPNHRAAYVLLGQLNYELKRYDEAIKNIEEALKFGQDAYCYDVIAASLAAKDDYGSAIESEKCALILEPNSTRIHGNLAHLYAYNGDHKQAIMEYTKAIEIQPDPILYTGRGVTNYMDGHITQAVDDCKKAIALKVDLADAYFGLAYAYLTLGQDQTAVEPAEAYIRLKGRSDERSSYMELVKYFGFLESGKIREATTLLEETSFRREESQWPSPVFDYLRDKITWQQLVEATSRPHRIGYATTTTGGTLPLLESSLDKDLLTGAHTYAAMKLALTGNKQEALERLKWVQNNGAKDVFEYQLALSRIRSWAH